MLALQRGGLVIYGPLSHEYYIQEGIHIILRKFFVDGVTNNMAEGFVARYDVE